MSLPNSNIGGFNTKEVLKDTDVTPFYDKDANYTFGIPNSVLKKFFKTFQKYSAKTYYSDEVYVVQGTGIYQLVNLTRPYVSSNFTTELANGDWELLVDFTAGSPPDLTPFVTKNGAQNEIKVSPTTIEDWGNILDGSGKATLKALIDFIGARLGATLSADDIIQSVNNQMISQAEKERLAELKDRFLGEYETLSALESAHPTANKADIAWVRPSGGSKTEYEYDGGWGIKPGGGGVSLPTGGTLGQVLKKASNAEGEYEWGDDEGVTSHQEDIINSVGDATQLNTTSKIIVGAINEILAAIGGLGNLSADDIDTLSEINAILTDADIATQSDLVGKKDKYITVPTSFPVNTPLGFDYSNGGAIAQASDTVEHVMTVDVLGKASTAGNINDRGLAVGAYWLDESTGGFTTTKPTEGLVKLAYLQGIGVGIDVWHSGYVIGESLETGYTITE